MSDNNGLSDEFKTAMAQWCAENPDKPVLPQISNNKYCSGEWPCEASTAAVYLEQERDELRERVKEAIEDEKRDAETMEQLRKVVRGSPQAEAAGLFHFAARLASFLWSVDKTTAQTTFDWVTAALDEEYAEDCPERTLMLGFHAAIAQRIEEIEQGHSLHETKPEPCKEGGHE
jgi:hypothetical protein